MNLIEENFNKYFPEIDLKLATNIEVSAIDVIIYILKYEEVKNELVLSEIELKKSFFP